MPEHVFFAGTYSKGKDNGLFSCVFNEDNGEIKITNSLDVENPSYLKIYNNILFGVSETAEYSGETGGALFSADISDPKKLKIIDINNTHGKHPCHLCVKDNLIFVSNYSEGSLSIFKTDKHGNIHESAQSIHHFGKSVNHERQEASHIHFSAVTPDDNFLCICDLGTDKIFLYPYSEEKGISTNAAIINCPCGAGPRHLVFSKCGGFLYILTELANTVLCYKYDKDYIKFLSEVSSLPENYKEKSFASAVHVSPDGKILAASNRGHDSIVFFQIENDGSLKYLSHIKTGKHPRDFRFSPGGKWLLSANQNDNTITSYSIDNINFKSTQENQLQPSFKCKIPKPVCIEFKVC